MPLRKNSDVNSKVKSGRDKEKIKKVLGGTKLKNKSNLKTKKDKEGKLFNYQQYLSKVSLKNK